MQFDDKKDFLNDFNLTHDELESLLIATIQISDYNDFMFFAWDKSYNWDCVNTCYVNEVLTISFSVFPDRNTFSCKIESWEKTKQYIVVEYYDKVQFHYESEEEYFQQSVVKDPVFSYKFLSKLYQKFENVRNEKCKNTH